MRKRIISLITAIALITTLFATQTPQYVYGHYQGYYPGQVKWTEGVTGGAIYFNKQTCKIVGCDTTVTEVIIPSEINDIDVMGIGYETFFNCDILKKVIIPNSVTTIGESAFRNCKSLTNITIPNSVTTIGEHAFNGCFSLTNITIPNSVTSIEPFTFNRCFSLTSITIPNSVTTIGAYAFALCKSLTSITIPNSVTAIGAYAFDRCESLTSVTIPNSVTTFGPYIFNDCNNLTIYCDPDSYAQKYANKYGIPFISTGKSEYKDVDDVNISIDTDQIKLFDDISGNIGDQPITKFFPGDYNLEFPFIESSVEKESMGDGTYILKMAIGIDKNKAFGDEDSWDILKQDIKKAQGDINDTKQIASLVNKWGNDCATVKVAKQIEPQMDLIGYYELVFDQNGKIIADNGGVVLGLELNAKYTQQCIAAPIPIPFFAEIGGTLDTKAKGNIEKVLYGSAPEFVGDVTIGIGLMAGAGVGVSGAAAVGVRGKGNIDMQVTTPSKGSLTAGVHAFTQALYVIEYELTIAETTYSLWDKSVSAHKINNNKQAYASDENIMSLVDRSYQINTSEWNGNSKNTKMIRASSPSSISFFALQEYIMPNTIPKIKKIGSDTVMIFPSNDADRETANSVKLMYSIYDGISWSEPEALWDNGTLDTFADITVVNDELYVVWSKCKKRIDDTGDVTSIAEQLSANSEICWSKYNEETKTFDEAEYITNNDNYDYTPIFVDSNEKIAVMWLNSDSNDIMGMNGSKKIMVSELEEDIWSDPEEVDSTSEYISELAGSYSMKGYSSAYITTSDSGDQKLYVSTNGKNNLIEYNTTSYISGLYSDNGKFAYTENGINKKYDIIDKTISEITAGESAVISANAKEISKDGKTTVIWMSNESDGCTFYSSVKINGGYSEPVELYKNKNLIGNYFDAELDSDGKWEIIFNATDISDSEKTSLYFVSRGDTPKIVLNDILINEIERVENSQPIYYSVTNDSEETLEKYTLTIDLSGKQIFEKEVQCNLAPGETKCMNETVNIGGLVGREDITVQVSAEEQTDMSESIMSEDINSFDIEITTDKYILKDTVRFVTSVSNKGETVEDIDVSIYGDAEKKNKIETVKITSLEAGSSNIATFELPIDKIKFDENETSYCSIVAETNKEEFNYDNNVYYGVIYKSEVFNTSIPDMDSTLTSKNVSLNYSNFNYTGKQIKPSPTVVVNGKILIKDTDYTVSYGTNKNPGYGSVTVTGIGDYDGKVTVKFTIAKVTGLKAKSTGTNSIKLSWTKQPNVKGYKVYRLVGNKYKLIKTVIGAKNTSYIVKNLAAGNGYKFKVRTYVGSKPYYGVYSSILSAPTKPGKVIINNLSTGKTHYVKVKWNQKTGTGYQVMIATNSKFTKNKTTYTVKSHKIKVKTIKGLKKGKTYYVKVRAYKTYGNKTQYGAWSKYKKIKCK